MEVDAQLQGVCGRCGSARIVLEVARRRCVLPTCGCRDEALKNMLDAVIDVLERELTAPQYDLARSELKEFITEFDEDA